MAFTTLSSSRCFGGTQLVLSHASQVTGTTMKLAVFVPPQANRAPVPVLWFLSGLTCTEENFTVKAGAQRVAAELGIMLVAPDTSPRGDGVPNDSAYDFGQGAGFYVDATQQPWAKHFQMASYLERELPGLIVSELPADPSRHSITGHSMGGHGALTMALRNPKRFRSVSAFAPIVAPSDCPWGQKALTGYLGPDRAAWRRYDACALIEDGARLPDLLIDQGSADQFLVEQLKPSKLSDVCRATGQRLTLRMQDGYDHSYYFIASFIEDHLRWHHWRLQA